MSTVTEIQAALDRLTEDEQREVAAWLEAKLWPETPAMLAAIDEGERSLREEPTVSVEELRQKIEGWVRK